MSSAMFHQVRTQTSSLAMHLVKGDFAEEVGILFDSIMKEKKPVRPQQEGTQLATWLQSFPTDPAADKISYFLKANWDVQGTEQQDSGFMSIVGSTFAGQIV